MARRWQRNSELVERRAVEYARGKGISYVTCGHTHLPMTSETDGVRYFNTGTWIEAPPCPFVSVRGDEVRVEFWPFAGSEVARVQSAEVPTPVHEAPALG